MKIYQLEQILELFSFNWIFEFQFVTFIYTIVYSENLSIISKQNTVAQDNLCLGKSFSFSNFMHFDFF